MRAAKTHHSRLISYNDPALKFDGAEALRKQIAAFVSGIKGTRKTPVSEKQIVAWFKSTSPEFVREQITHACGESIRIVRTSLRTRGHNRAYRYVPIGD